MSEDIPDKMSDRMPEDTPDRMPEDLPDRMPEDMPEDMPEHMPEDMPEHMPEDMPDRMPDRMPEDLPVRKCINVMVGITRSKVFFSLGSIEHRPNMPSKTSQKKTRGEPIANTGNVVKARVVNQHGFSWSPHRSWHQGWGKRFPTIRKLGFWHLFKTKNMWWLHLKTKKWLLDDGVVRNKGCCGPQLGGIHGAISSISMDRALGIRSPKCIT